MRLRDQIADALDQCGPMSTQELSGELQRRAGMKPPPPLSSLSKTAHKPDVALRMQREQGEKLSAYGRAVAEAGYSVTSLWKLLRWSGLFEPVYVIEDKPKIGPLTVVRWKVKDHE